MSVTSRVGTLLLCSAMAATSMGCADIRLTTVDTQTEVLSSHQKIVTGRSVKVRSRIDGTTLYLQTNQGCDLVEMEEVRTIEEREADEDLTEEFTVFGLATLPLTTGIVMLADAPNVYEDDRNSNQYNNVGPTGAYVGGTILTAVGGIMALVPIIELMRVAAAGEERETTSTRQGRVVETDVQCEATSRTVRTSVTLRVGARNIATRGTDHNGHLELDLAKAIPYDAAKKAVMVQVIVAGKVVGELDIEPILDAQEEMRREQEVQVWQSVDKNRCLDAPSSDHQACSSVKAFLARFPDGMYAQEAQSILKARERKMQQVIAEDPNPDATVPSPDPEGPKPSPFEGVEAEAEKEAAKAKKQACKRACVKRCVGKPKAQTCAKTCVEEVCQ